MILLDADIASALAKGRGLDPVLNLFQEIRITPEVWEELQVPLDHGFSYPKSIFDKIDLVDPTSEEQRRYREMFQRRIGLGKGELESIAVAVVRNCKFSSLDKKAVRFAQKERVKVVVLKTILKGLWKRKISSKEEVRELVKRIEREDNRRIDTEGVFEK